MKKCSTCKAQKEVSSFYKNSSARDGYHIQCKDCCRSSERKYRKTEKGRLKRKEIKHRNYKQTRAQVRLEQAICIGKIKKRNSCEICHCSPTHCHHEDYSKPFDFIELCGDCHRKLHRQILSNARA